MLRHTSGLTYSFQQRTAVDAADRNLRLDAFQAESLEAFVDGLGRVPLEFSPGTHGIKASRPTSSATS